MKAVFCFEAKGKFEYLHYWPWTEQGVIHGYTTATSDFSDKTALATFHSLAAAFGVKKVLYPKQVHGCSVLDLRGVDIECHGEIEADSLIFDLSASADTLYAIRTADCLPIAVVSRELATLIHAGWRGLAAGIIEETLTLIDTPVPELNVLIGPAADPRLYEVGEEVIKALGNKAVYITAACCKFYLDLPQTAARIMNRYGIASDNIKIAPFATMSDVRFHSYRRLNKDAGRGALFMIA
ncbi:MAG: hypothetical protein D6719_04790 [Candidatus Dadabacteria bacterium]|nr:MAG: hypothetical protein D6719_04790 [Candidatus Dadabacteria bacterium]